MESWTISQKWLYFNLFARGKILDKRASESDNASCRKSEHHRLRIPARDREHQPLARKEPSDRFLQLANRPSSEPILMKITSDFLVIGSGIAGLSYALKVADRGPFPSSPSGRFPKRRPIWPRGESPRSFSAEDSFEAHVRDTMVAGAFLSHEDVVRMVVESGPKAIQDLIDWGVQFTKKADDTYDLTREGGHSQRRILHAQDLTGREIERALVEAVRAHPNITVYENHIAVDLITEAKVTHRPATARPLPGRLRSGHQRPQGGRPSRRGSPFSPPAAQERSISTPAIPDVATGDGVAMAYRAGRRPSPTWNSSSSTRPPSTIPTPSPS